jgi:hypothetical protein
MNTIADATGLTAAIVDFDKKKLKVDALLSNAKPSARSLSSKFVSPKTSSNTVLIPS